MPNTVGLPEMTLAEMADSTQFDAVMAGSDRKVVRASNHADNDATEIGSDTNKMAIFECRGRGYPWVKQANVLSSVTHVGELPPTNVTLLFADWDYTQF